MFDDREQAGRELTVALGGSVRPDTVVLGIPRGGVIVAAEVAKALGARLDVIVVRKIGHPGNPEYAVGAVDAAGRIVRGQERVPEQWIAAEGERERREAERREREYRLPGGVPLDVSGRTAVVVDDGIATGLTVRAAVESLKARGAARVVVAAPVASPDAVRTLAGVADEIVVLDAPQHFGAVGAFYARFPQTTDAEVLDALAAARRAEGTAE